MSEADQDILRSWKEIERFLKMGRKTILACGYPVYKEQKANNRNCFVYAFKSELKNFMSRPENKISTL